MFYNGDRARGDLEATGPWATVKAPINGHIKRRTALITAQIFSSVSGQIFIKNVPKCGQLQLADIKKNSRWRRLIRASTVVSFVGPLPPQGEWLPAFPSCTSFRQILIL